MKQFDPSIQLVKVPVTNFAQARAFYGDVLGLEEEFAEAIYGWAQFKCGPLPLCVYVVGMGGGVGVPGGETNFHLEVNDVVGAYALLLERGATLPGPLSQSDEGGSFFVVADPDGNRFKVMQRPPAK